MRDPCLNCEFAGECFDPCDKYLEYMELMGNKPEPEDLPVLQQITPR